MCIRDSPSTEEIDDLPSPSERGLFSFLDDKEKGELSDFTTPLALIDVAIGFANST